MEGINYLAPLFFAAWDQWRWIDAEKQPNAIVVSCLLLFTRQERGLLERRRGLRGANQIRASGRTQAYFLNGGKQLGEDDSLSSDF